MYTSSSTVRRILKPVPAGVFLLAAALHAAGAQDPVRLPTVVISAPTMPGPKVMAGVVRDTAGFEIEGVEIIIADLRRSTRSRIDGSFRFDSLPKGTYTMRARKFGYAPQIREFKVNKDGGLAEFELLPIPRALPPMVTTAERGGLSGVVGDTAFNTIAGALIRLVGEGVFTQTDSLGGFYLPAGAGTYMVSIQKPGFADRMVGVTIPRDSGRRITAWLEPRTGKLPVREANNIEDLRYRLAWRNPTKSTLWTRDELERGRYRSVWEAVNATHAKNSEIETYSYDCRAIINGGPSHSDISTLSLDEIESIEIYGEGGIGQISRRDAKDQRVPLAMSNTRHASIGNSTRVCPPAIYIWLR